MTTETGTATAPAVRVAALTPALRDDYLRFFDTRAFPDSPRWASCYCHFPLHDPSRIEWPAQTAQDNRAAACDGLRERGLREVRARPKRDARGAADNHTGPLELYLSEGFTVLQEDDEGWVYVRKPLA